MAVAVARGCGFVTLGTSHLLLLPLVTLERAVTLSHRPSELTSGPRPLSHFKSTQRITDISIA